MNALLLVALSLPAQSPDISIEIHLKFNDYEPVDQSWKAKIRDVPANVHVHKTYGEMGYRINRGQWVPLTRDAIPHPLFWGRFFDYLDRDYCYEERLRVYEQEQRDATWRDHHRFYDIVREAVKERFQIEEVNLSGCWVTDGKVHIYAFDEDEKIVPLVDLLPCLPPAIAEDAPPLPPPLNPLEYMLIFK